MSVTKATCCGCGEIRTVNKDGFLRRHRHGRDRVCRGSGKVPLDAHEARVAELVSENSMLRYARIKELEEENFSLRQALAETREAAP